MRIVVVVALSVCGIAWAGPETLQDVRARELKASIEDVTAGREGACVRLDEALEPYWNPKDRMEWPRKLRSPMPPLEWRAAADACAAQALAAPAEAPWMTEQLLVSAVLQDAKHRKQAIEQGRAAKWLSVKPDGSVEWLGRSGGEDRLDQPHTSQDPTQADPVVSGFDVELTRMVLRANRHQVQYCYERELAKAPGLKGTLAVRFEVKKGVVGKVTLEESTLGNARVEACVLERVAHWKFQPRTFVVTFSFQLAPL